MPTGAWRDPHSTSLTDEGYDLVDVPLIAARVRVQTRFAPTA